MIRLKLSLIYAPTHLLTYSLIIGYAFLVTQQKNGLR